jgi:hypothetical protein
MFHAMFSKRKQRSWMQSRGNYLGGQAYGSSSYSDGCATHFVTSS